MTKVTMVVEMEGFENLERVDRYTFRHPETGHILKPVIAFEVIDPVTEENVRDDISAAQDFDAYGIGVLDYVQTEIELEVKTFEAVAVRYGKFNKIDNVLFLSAGYTGTHDINSFLSALQRAVTAWAQNTIAGQKLAEYSAYDLNIGDLSSHGIDDELKSELLAQGITDLEIGDKGKHVNEFSYDFVLLNEE